MFNWQLDTQTATLNCEDECGASFAVNKDGFTSEEWAAFGPEERLKDVAVAAKWQYLFASEKNQVVFVCRNCANVRLKK
jgi:hypothetical protein